MMLHPMNVIVLARRQGASSDLIESININTSSSLETTKKSKSSTMGTISKSNISCSIQVVPRHSRKIIWMDEQSPKQQNCERDAPNDSSLKLHLCLYSQLAFFQLVISLHVSIQLLFSSSIPVLLNFKESLYAEKLLYQEKGYSSTILNEEA